MLVYSEMHNYSGNSYYYLSLVADFDRFLVDDINEAKENQSSLYKRLIWSEGRINVAYQFINPGHFEWSHNHKGILDGRLLFEATV